MRQTVISIISLFFGTLLLLVGHGLLGTLLSLRASLESFSGTMIGLIMTAYFAGYIFGTFRGPALINRIGHIRVFAISASVASAIVVIHGLIVNPWLWMAARFLYGACVVVFYLVIESWLNDRAGNELRGRIFSIYTFINLIALALGQQLLLIGDAQQLDLFAISAILFSLSLVPIARTRLPEPNRVTAPAVDLRKVISNSPVGFAGCLASGLVGGAFWTMSPLYALNSGLTEDQVAGFMSVPIIGGALAQIPAGLISDRYDRRSTILIFSLIAAMFAFATIFIASMPYALTLTAMLGFGAAYFSLYPLSIAHSNDRAAPEDLLTIGSTLLLTYGIGAMISPVLTGTMIEALGVASMPVFYVITLTILALLCAQQIKRKAPVAEEDKAEFTPLVRTSSVAMEVQSEEAGELANQSDYSRSNSE